MAWSLMRETAAGVIPVELLAKATRRLKTADQAPWPGLRRPGRPPLLVAKQQEPVTLQRVLFVLQA